MRKRPREHKRRLKSGKVIVVNKGMKRKRAPVAMVLRDIGRQSGRTNRESDLKYVASEPGERRSKTGKIYWETRQNRSDIDPAVRL